MDMSGYGNHGKLVGGLYLQGWFAYSDASRRPYFDGTSGYIEVGDIPQVNFGSGSYTLHAKISTVDLDDRQSIFGKDEASGRQFGLEICSQNTSASRGNFRMIVFSDNSTYRWEDTANNVISAYTWYDVWGVRNGDDFNLYLTGEGGALTQVGFSTSGGSWPKTMQDASSPLRIGARSYASNEDFWDGLIYDARIWNRALSTDEMIRIQNNRFAPLYPA